MALRAANAVCSGVAQPRSTTARSRRVSPFKSAMGSSQRPGNALKRYGAIVSDRLLYQCTLLKIEPTDFVWVECAPNVFENTGPLVIVARRPSATGRSVTVPPQ
jgi:hypothetical protein